VNIVKDIKKYKFLINQLVSRDFKTKYKRSFLGVLWSLLNPLLTMAVQYAIFSTLFRFDLPHYQVYLLSGIVMFNFFSEATNQAITSITGNASLITKVYMPKYVFPVTKVLSSCINLFFSLIALYVIVLASGLKITLLHIFIPFALINMFIYTIGFSLILSSLMVFFRDMQFLYGVAIMLWNYITPIFYPENIIGPKFKWILQFNPMYHYIRYVRSIILDNSMPTVRAHIICLIFSIGTLVIGWILFRKSENKFIFNL
jgi:ABC-2 type transport system permease protein